MSDLNISAEVSKKKKNAIILHLNGFLDGATAPKLDNIVKKIFEKNCYNIVFDLSNVSYISSAGIGTFTAFNKTATEQNGKIILAQLPESIKKVFNLLGFTILFSFADSIEAAEEKLVK